MKYTGQTQTKTPEHNAWRKMMLRCYDPKNKDYARYHGKGITVCEFLRQSSRNLVAILGRRPQGLTLDRLDNRLGYNCGQCPDCIIRRVPVCNIRWASRTIQSRNQDRIRLITIGKVSACIGEWSKRTGIHYQTLMSRYKAGRRGPALILPPKRKFSR